MHELCLDTLCEVEFFFNALPIWHAAAAAAASLWLFVQPEHETVASSDTPHLRHFPTWFHTVLCRSTRLNPPDVHAYGSASLLRGNDAPLGADEDEDEDEDVLLWKSSASACGSVSPLIVRCRWVAWSHCTDFYTGVYRGQEQSNAIVAAGFFKC